MVSEGAAICLHLRGSVTITQVCCEFQVQIPTSGSSTSQDKILRDFYVKIVLQTKCHRSPTFNTFLGLDVLSDCKSMEKLVNGFLTVIYGLCKEEKSDNGWE